MWPLFKRHYHGRPIGWQLVKVIKNGFNFTLILSQISELYWSLVHLHTHIYGTLEFLPSEASNTSLDSAITSSDAVIRTLDTESNPQISCMSFFLRCLSIFISITIFGDYAWSHAYTQMSSQLFLICTILISLQVFYEGRVFVTCWVRTIVSSPNL